MIQIELKDGYMVCQTCKGYLEAGDLSPGCECQHEFTDNSLHLTEH